MKKKGNVTRKAAIALSALACNWFLDMENKCFYGDLYDTEDAMSWKTATFRSWSLTLFP